MRLVLASSNAGKIVELKEYLKHLPVELVLQPDLNMEEVEETGGTFIENAIIKARYAAHRTGMPALADDSGLVVEALGGAPGVFSSRYAADDSARIAKLLQAMHDIPDTQRTAYFYCALVYMEHSADPAPSVFLGRWYGNILREPKGSNGFGYDPVFYVPEHGCSAAELDSVVKNAISHRARAMQEGSSFFEMGLKKVWAK